jgi:hypothetical protein
MEEGGYNWSDSLGDIARVINTTPCFVLPRHTTPSEVFFGRKPRFDKAIPMENNQSNYGSNFNSGSDEFNSDSDSFEEPQETEEDIRMVLTALEQRVFKKNTKVNEGYAKRGGISKEVFAIGDIVTLAIEKKRRVVGEPLRLPCRIVSIENEKYSLLSAIGWLSGWYTSNQLNSTNGAMANANIPSLPLGLNRISLSAAFKELYNRPSITALQKGKGKKIEVPQQKVRGPEIATLVSVELGSEEMEESSDAIEDELSINDEVIAQELEEEALQEEQQEEAQESIQEQGVKDKAQEMAQAIEDCLKQETEMAASTESTKAPITPRNRRKRLQYSPSPIQRQRRRVSRGNGRGQRRGRGSKV